MVNEHGHQWEFYPEADDTLLGLCMFPGCHEKKQIALQETSYTTIARYRLHELEQQLAQARALLERLTDEWTPVMQRCCYCEASYDYPSSDESTLEHADDCPILLARAFLAQHKE